MKAYRRSPDLANSSWYKGIITTQLATSSDTNGQFDCIVGHMRQDTEPPPHVHENEDEFFYLLEGSMRIYVDGQVIDAKGGDSVFLPRGIPHAFRVTSPELRVLVVVTPGGFADAIGRLNEPAKRMEIPSDKEMETYATTDLSETIKVFTAHGIRFLSPEEIDTVMPAYLSA